MTVRGIRCLWLLAGLFGAGGCIAQSLEKSTLESEDGDTGSTSHAEGTSRGTVGTSTGPAAEDESTGPNQAGTTLEDDDVTSSGRSDAAATGGEYGGACCQPHDAPGCDDEPGVDTCVCEVDDYCCNVEWDEVCTDLAHDLGCIDCNGPDTQGTDLPGDCCSPTRAAGCIDPDVEACVCDADPFCCEVAWDEACVEDTDFYQCGCAEPPGTSDTSDTSETTDTGGPVDCCVASPEPGCGDPEIEACVCALDEFCCDTAWDQQCTGLMSEGGCGMCTYPQGTGDCCVENGTAGCDDPDIQDCVCVGDPFCCTIEWDGICAIEVEEFMCGSCPGFGGTGGGTGDTDGMTEPPGTGSTGM